MSKETYCSFCGKDSKNVDFIITGKSANICDECVVQASTFIHQRKNVDTARPVKDIDLNVENLPTPIEIKNKLDEYVIGQDEAKISLAVAVYNHYKRISIAFDDDIELEKSNILLIGGTGTGKTLLAQTLAKILHVPFAIADATTLTEAGYVGEDVENILVRLYQASGFRLEDATRGIIYIDEIDKINRRSGSSSITRDVSGEGVQQALLKILEGTVANIPPKGGRKHPEQSFVSIDTKNILFICGGAFDGLEEIVLNRMGKSTIGFSYKSKKKEINSNSLKELISEDLVRFGIIPELIGRLPVITVMEELDKKALFRILTEPKNSLIKQYKKLFLFEGVDLKITDSALEEVVQIALKQKTGARGLRSILENVMKETMFTLPSIPNVAECLITDEVIKKKGKPILKRWKKMEESPKAI